MLESVSYKAFTTEITKITEKNPLKIFVTSVLSVVNAIFSYKLGLKKRSLTKTLPQLEFPVGAGLGARLKHQRVDFIDHCAFGS